MTRAAEEEMRVLELQLQEALEHIEFLQDQQVELLDALEEVVVQHEIVVRYINGLGYPSLSSFALACERANVTIAKVKEAKP